MIKLISIIVLTHFFQFNQQILRQTYFFKLTQQYFFYSVQVRQSNKIQWKKKRIQTNLKKANF